MFHEQRNDPVNRSIVVVVEVEAVMFLLALSVLQCGCQSAETKP